MTEVTYRSAHESVPAAAVELDHALDQMIDQFARENEPLIRRACQVGADVPSDKMRSVVVYTLLSHTVSVVRRSKGPAHVQALVQKLLAGLDQMEPLGAASGRVQ